MRLDSFDAFIGSHEVLRSKFRVTEDSMVYHARLTEEMAKRSKKSTSLSINAHKRWEKQSNCNAIASDLHMPIEDESANEDEALKRTTKQPKLKKAVTFVRDNPPTVEMIAAYCLERKNGIKAQAFFDSNTAVGWVDKNKTPYRDWKAVVRKWENYRQDTATPALPAPSKRPVGIVVVEKIAAGMEDRDIMQALVGTYSEHAITEALMQARGKVQ